MRTTSQYADPAATQTYRFTRLQRLMVAHGVLILFMTLVAGLGLWISLVGGFELIPGSVIEFQIPGTPEGWARAHRGTPLNAFLVIAVALILPGLGFSERAQTLLGWTIVATGWSNTVFYFFSNSAQNRGLTFGANHFGPGSIESFIALAPAYFFGVLSMVGLIVIARKAFRDEEPLQTAPGATPVTASRTDARAHGSVS